MVFSPAIDYSISLAKLSNSTAIVTTLRVNNRNDF